jgi:hypothetical protein
MADQPLVESWFAAVESLESMGRNQSPSGVAQLIGLGIVNINNLR